MDLSSLKGIVNKLEQTKALGWELAQRKAAKTMPSSSGTGVHSPGSFGVNANTKPASVRMAGGIGMQKLAATLIHSGLNKYVLPQADRFMNNIATDIKEGIAENKPKRAISGY